MKKIMLWAFCLLISGMQTITAQSQRQIEMFGDTARASKLVYAKSMFEAKRLAYQQKKLIFVNCYADWAAPCLGMEQFVFSNQPFADYMNSHFINLFVDTSTEEGKAFAKEYGVKSYAFYLILNYKGDVVQPISGGKKLPEFQDFVNLSLSDSTSVAGTAATYQSGNYSKQQLYHYVKALRVAGNDSLFAKLGREYVTMLDPEEYAESKNWLFSPLFKKQTSEYYQYVVAHKGDFVRSVGLTAVDNYLEAVLCPPALRYALGDEAYNADGLGQLRKHAQQAVLPDTSATVLLLDIADLRGQRNIKGLLDFLDKNGHYFDKYHSIRSTIELSMNFDDINEADRVAIADYIEKAAAREKGVQQRRLNEFLTVLRQERKGIAFVNTPFDEVLQQARKEKKLIFMDCYTSWCGPCRAMASSVFPQEAVGEVFNPNFVSVKMDMEKGEGIALAKRFGVTAYPTLLFLDAEGNVLKKVMGYQTVEKLNGHAQEVMTKTGVGK